jgi:hypothetical protein
MTDRQDAAAEFIRSEQDTAHHAAKITDQLADAVDAATAATPWIQAFIQWRAQQILAQRLRSEVNGALSSQGRPQQFVPAIHNANLWSRIEGNVNRAADELATKLVDRWRDERTRYETGEQENPPTWPTAKEVT